MDGFKVNYIFFFRNKRRLLFLGGDIRGGRGNGGESIYGETFADETFVVKHNQRGILGQYSRPWRSSSNSIKMYFSQAWPTKATDTPMEANFI